MRTLINNTTLYLSGEDIENLKSYGAVLCVYSVSDMIQYHNHITTVYFFDEFGCEVAHITGISEGIHYYRRKWGDQAKERYKRARNFDMLLTSDLRKTINYKVI